MSSCEVCGAPGASGERFCPRCGTARRGGGQPSWRGWLGAGAVLAVMGGLALVVFGPSGGDPANSELTYGDPPDQTQQQAEQVAEQQVAEQQAAEPQDAATGASDASETDREVLPEGVQAVRQVADGPVLGAEVGLSLWIAGSEERLRHLDLDTGQLTVWERSGNLVYADSDWLLVDRPGGESIGRVSARHPDRPLEPLPMEHIGFGLPLAGPEPGVVWVPHGEGEVRWALLDVESMMVFESIDAGVGMRSFVGITAAPEIVGSSSGGTYVRENGGYRRVVDHTPLVASDDLVLAVLCATPAECELTWFDRRTWQQLDRPVPPEVPVWARLSHGGRYLGYFGSEGPHLQLFDVEANAMVETAADSEAFGIGQFATSPDGRYLALADGGLVFVNTETGTETRIDESFNQFSEVTLLFVEND